MHCAYDWLRAHAKWYVPSAFLFREKVRLGTKTVSISFAFGLGVARFVRDSEAEHCFVRRIEDCSDK